MQAIGNIHIKIDHKGVLQELALIQQKNGTSRYHSLDRERNHFNTLAGQNLTRVLSVEQIGSKHYTRCTTLPKKYQFSKNDLELINETLQKQLKNTGRQKIVVVF